MTPEELALLHEKQLDQVIDSIRGSQHLIEKRILSAISAARADPKKSIAASFWADRLKGIIDQFDGISARWNSWLGTKDRGAILNSFRDGIRAASKLVKKIIGPRAPDSRLPYDAKTINAFIDDSRVIMQNAVDSGKTQVRRLFRATQQDLIREREINQLLTQEQINAGTPRTFRSALQKTLEEKLGDGKFITINGRNYNVADYADLVARTRIREAQSIGTIRTCQEYGVDLVRWVPADPCPICTARAKQPIYSISGSHKKYPRLEDSGGPPPAHPRCVCVIVPYFEEKENAPT